MNYELPDYWYSRWLLERGLALIYLVAFLAAVNQFIPLAGERGLLPAPRFLTEVPFRDSPSIFHWLAGDRAFVACAWLGVVLSVVALVGVTSRLGAIPAAMLWGALYVLYLSFINAGQTWYGFGWESLLVEIGFFTMFAGARGTPPHLLLNWIYRWTLFRLMFGAGLIKIRGDACWRDLTCLDYFFETQPMPNPLSWYMHHLPRPVLHGGVAFNHFVELIVPFGFFLPQPVRRRRRPDHHRFSIDADRGRQPVVAELADDRPRHLHARRPLPVVAPHRQAGLQPIPGRSGSPPRARRCRRHPEHSSDAEHAVARAGDEHGVQSAADRQHLRRLRKHHQGALRDRRSKARSTRRSPARRCGGSTNSRASPAIRRAFRHRSRRIICGSTG